jgi:hypothetical protein
LDPEEKLEDWLLGELGSPAESAVMCVEAGGDLGVGEVEVFCSG